MKNLTLAITSLTIALTLSSCGGTTIEAANNDFNPSGIESGSLSLSSSVGEFGSVQVSSTVQLSINGGTAPYSVELISGDGSIDSSGYVFTAGATESTVGVRVTDASQNTVDHYFYVVSQVVGTSTTCLEAADPVVSQSSAGLEVLVDTTALTDLDQVITGVGLRAYNDTMFGMYVKTEKLGDDGSVSESPAYASTNGHLGGTARGELYIEAPSGYYVYGVGAASDSSGMDVDAIKIYVARADVDTSIFETMECVVSAEGSECDNTVSLPAGVSTRYYEFNGRDNKPLVALGTSINGATVDRMAAKSRALSFESCE